MNKTNNLLNTTAELLLMTFNNNNLSSSLLSTITNNDTSKPETIINYDNLAPLSHNFNYTVCKVERETQKQVTFINGIRGPIGENYFNLIFRRRKKLEKRQLF